MIRNEESATTSGVEFLKEFFGQSIVGLGLQGDGAVGQPALSLFRPDDWEAADRLQESKSRGLGPDDSTSVASAIDRYLAEKTKLDDSTRAAYRTTRRKLAEWAASQILHGSARPMQISELAQRGTLKAFLDWVYEQSVAAGDGNPGRTANKCHENLHAVCKWLVDETRELDALPRFPEEKEQRDAAGLYFLTEEELNALYWATNRMRRPHGWREEHTVGAYWRAALTCFYTYGMDTQTLFPYDRRALPLLWRHICWDALAPDRKVRLTSEWGWLFYRRKKTGKPFMLPMTREVNLHLEAIKPKVIDPEARVFARSGSSRPCVRFQDLIRLARIKPKIDFETGEESEWIIKDLRKTSTTWHEENLPGASSAVVGHSDGSGDKIARVTEKHYANRSPLQHRSITTLQYPSAFRSIWDEAVKPPSDLLFAK